MATILLIIFLMLGILGGIAFLVYTTFIQKKKKKPAPTQQPQTAAQPPQEKKEKTMRIDSIKDFYDNFSRIGKNPKDIVKALENVEYESYDRGKLKDFLLRHGLSFQEREEVMDTLYDVFVEKKYSKIVEKEIPHYRNLGWKDDEIRQHFISHGYDKQTIEAGFKEFHKKNIYMDYIDRIVKHMKGFVLSGKEDKEILELFEEHGWPKEILEEALEKTKRTLDEERSIAFLEEEILKLILAGESKEKIAKVLTKRGWPEDELKHHYEDIKQGLKNLEEELERVDVNQYNLDKIRDVLRRKNWPDPIVEKTIVSLKENVEYHRKLKVMKQEAYNLVEQGYNSQQLRKKLNQEGWDEGIIKKTINSINKELAASDRRDKMKQFNDHIFSKDEWHQHMNRYTRGFEEGKPIATEKPEEKAFSDLKNIAQSDKQDDAHDKTENSSA